jgi:hypothetical protein
MQRSTAKSPLPFLALWVLPVHRRPTFLPNLKSSFFFFFSCSTNSPKPPSTDPRTNSLPPSRKQASTILSFANKWDGKTLLLLLRALSWSNKCREQWSERACKGSKVWGFMICGTTHTHASPLLLHLLLNSSCLPCASPTELSARWVLSSSHQIPNKRSLLSGSDTGSTQGSPQRDRDRENEIRVWTQIEEKEVASSSSRSNRACGVRPHNRCLDLLRRACVRACVREMGFAFCDDDDCRATACYTLFVNPRQSCSSQCTHTLDCVSLLSPSPASSTCLNPTHPHTLSVCR